MFKLIIASALLGMATFVQAECPGDCSGHGTCGLNDKCSCYAMWQGIDCSLRTCPSGWAWADTAADSGHHYSECSNKGSCDRKSGECQCDDGYTGAACRRSTCMNDCNGHGTCETIAELAMDSSQQVGGKTYNAYDGWDGAKNRVCKCDARYTGLDCSSRMCPKGNDPLTVDVDVTQTETTSLQVEEIQNVTIQKSSAGGSGQGANMNGGQVTFTYTDLYNGKWTTRPVDLPLVKTHENKNTKLYQSTVAWVPFTTDASQMLGATNLLTTETGDGAAVDGTGGTANGDFKFASGAAVDVKKTGEGSVYDSAYTDFKEIMTANTATIRTGVKFFAECTTHMNGAWGGTCPLAGGSALDVIGTDGITHDGTIGIVSTSASQTAISSNNAVGLITVKVLSYVTTVGTSVSYRSSVVPNMPDVPVYTHVAKGGFNVAKLASQMRRGDQIMIGNAAGTQTCAMELAEDIDQTGTGASVATEINFYTVAHPDQPPCQLTGVDCSSGTVCTASSNDIYIFSQWDHALTLGDDSASRIEYTGRSGAAITGISQAAEGVITVATNMDGTDTPIVRIMGIDSGMTQANGLNCVAKAATTTSAITCTSLDTQSSAGFAAWTSGGTVQLYAGEGYATKLYASTSSATGYYLKLGGVPAANLANQALMPGTWLRVYDESDSNGAFCDMEVYAQPGSAQTVQDIPVWKRTTTYQNWATGKDGCTALATLGTYGVAVLSTFTVTDSASTDYPADATDTITFTTTTTNGETTSALTRNANFNAADVLALVPGTVVGITTSATDRTLYCVAQVKTGATSSAGTLTLSPAPARFTGTYANSGYGLTDCTSITSRAATAGDLIIFGANSQLSYSDDDSNNYARFLYTEEGSWLTVSGMTTESNDVVTMEVEEKDPASEILSVATFDSTVSFALGSLPNGGGMRPAMMMKGAANSNMGAVATVNADGTRGHFISTATTVQGAATGLVQTYYNANCSYCLVGEGADKLAYDAARDVERALKELPNQVIPDVSVALTSNSISMYSYNVTFHDAATTGDQASLVMNAQGCNTDGCAPRYDGVRRQTIYSKADGVVSVTAGSTNEFTSGSTLTFDTASGSGPLTISGTTVFTFTGGDPGDDFVTQFTDATVTPYIYITGISAAGVCTVSKTTAPTAQVLTCSAFTGTAVTQNVGTVVFTEAQSTMVTAAGGDLVTFYGANPAYSTVTGPDTVKTIAQATSDKINLMNGVTASASGATTVVVSKTLTEEAIKTDSVVSRTYEIQRGTTEASECSGRGACDSESGVCECYKGYRGPACATQNAIV